MEHTKKSCNCVRCDTFLKKNSSNDLKDGSITSSKLAKYAVTKSKLANNSVTGSKIPDNCIGTSKIEDGAITSSKLASNSITNDKIPDNCIVTAKLDDDSVTVDKIPDDEIPIHKLEHRLFTVPYYFGQYLNFSSNVNNLRIILTVKNTRVGALEFGSDPTDTFQFWICYFSELGKLGKPGAMTAYFPESIVVNDSPAGTTIASGDTFSYDLTINNIHFEKPEAALSWYCFVRIYSHNYGTDNFGENTPLVALQFTSWA